MISKITSFPMFRIIEYLTKKQSSPIKFITIKKDQILKLLKKPVEMQKLCQNVNIRKVYSLKHLHDSLEKKNRIDTVLNQSSKEVPFPNTKTSFSTTVELPEFKLHNLSSGPSTTATLDRDEAIEAYTKMIEIRRLENALGTLYKEKIIRGFCHLYIGQEAVAVGMRRAMRDNDSIITAYRCHGWAHLMGCSFQSIISELAGRKSGSQRGKGGSMHIYSKNFAGGNGIVGAQVPLGTGMALAHQYKNDGGVNFSLYGDGAANQGQIFEAYNIAKLWSLPAVFVCENNEYAMGTAASRGAASTDFYTRGDYIPGLWVDGMNYLATREATKFCIEYCTKGEGPLVVEMNTYRYMGHSMSDPGTSYRTRDEIQKVRQTRDPINTFKEMVIEADLMTEDECKTIESKTKKHMEECSNKAKGDPETGMEDLCGDTYAKNLEPFIRGVHPGIPLKHVNIGKPRNLE